MFTILFLFIYQVYVFILPVLQKSTIQWSKTVQNLFSRGLVKQLNTLLCFQVFKMLANKESLEQIIAASPGLSSDPVALGSLALKRITAHGFVEIRPSLISSFILQVCFRIKICSFSLQTQACWTCEFSPNTRNHMLPQSFIQNISEHDLTFLSGWSDLTRHWSTLSSWSCTRWPAACPANPAAARPATCRPVLTVKCQVNISHINKTQHLMLFTASAHHLSVLCLWQEVFCSTACQTMMRISNLYVFLPFMFWCYNIYIYMEIFIIIVIL